LDSGDESADWLWLSDIILFLWSSTSLSKAWTGFTWSSSSGSATLKGLDAFSGVSSEIKYFFPSAALLNVLQMH